MTHQAQISTGEITQTGVNLPLSPLRLPLQMDTSEARKIEEWLERKTMERLDVLAEYKFWQAMEGMQDVRIRGFEVILPFPAEIMKELVAVTYREDTVLERVWV